MAADEPWFVGEDGCLSVGEAVHSVTYHSTLNTILVSTKEPTVKVIDVTSGSVLQSCNLTGWSFFSLEFDKSLHNVVVLCVDLFKLNDWMETKRYNILARTSSTMQLISRFFRNHGEA